MLQIFPIANLITCVIRTLGMSKKYVTISRHIDYFII